MKKIKLMLALIVMMMGGVLSANAQEVDVTTLDWVQKGQGCNQDFDNPNGGTVFGTDASGSNLSYVDISAYGTIKLYGTAGQTARLFINREEIGDKGIIYVDIDENGVGVYDCSNLLELQPTIQYIHLNGVKASAYNTTLNLSSITVSGDPIAFPEDVWVCPEGETDVTKLAWTQNAQGCTNNLGTLTDATVWGTDVGGANISYVDLSAYGSIKVYGPAGQRARFFINREEYASGTFQFFADIDENGVGVLNLDGVYAAQEGAEYIHLNGIKAASYGAKLQLDGITVVEKPWICPATESDYTSLVGYKDVNNVGKSLNGGDVVYGDQSNGDNYTDVTAFDQVKFYGTPGAMLRIFANRAGGESVTVGTNEQRVTIGEDGVGVLDVKAVMTATSKEYCRLSGIKICAKYQGATVDENIVIKGITVYKTIAEDILADESAKVIDARGVTGTGITLESANPNCIFLASEGVLANENNVCVNGTINKLVINDTKPFALPAEATTATAASYSRTIEAASNWGTACLPYAIASDANVQLYTVESVTSSEVILAKAESVEPGVPVIFKKKTENSTSIIIANQSSSELSAAQTAAKLVGTYNQQVLTEGLNTKYAVSNNQFIQATSTLTVKAFRAYLETGAPAGANLRIIANDFESDETTSVEEFMSDGTVKVIEGYYSIGGAPVTADYPGITVVKYTDGTTQTIKK